MKIKYVKGQSTVFEFADSELAVAYYHLAEIVKQCGGKTSADTLRLTAILADMEFTLKQRILQNQQARRFHLCCKCFKEIDTEKDKYHHTQFESGYEVWSHQDCPAVNTGKGYEQ